MVPYDLAVSTTDANTLWIVRTSMYGSSPNMNGNMVYKSTDGGNNWTNVTTAFLDGEYPTNIIHQRGSNGGIYIGTRRAVYYKTMCLLIGYFIITTCLQAQILPGLSLITGVAK